jgi:hypothetical protein
MKVSKELESYILDIVSKAVENTKDGEDSAGYANAVMMASKAHAYFLAVEQAQAMNFVGPKPMEAKDGKGKPETQN